MPLIGSCTYECWGARGGNDPAGNSSSTGGYGGYTKGNASFVKLTQLYSYVGGQGKSNLKAGQSKANEGGWNGGGGSGNNQTATVGAGGGGATDFRLSRASSNLAVWNEITSLRSRIMVAAGGGGGVQKAAGASGGGLVGNSGINGGSYADDQFINTGGGQQATGSCDHYTNGNMSAEFQVIVNDPTCLTPYGTFGYADPAGEEQWWGGGGGGGWYGGVLGYGRSGSGGSSFISGHSGCYAVNQSTSTSTTTYHKSGTNKERYDDTYYFTGTSMTAGATNSPGGNNGYARITMVTPVNN